MDFLDPKKQKQHKIRLIIGYILIPIAIFVVAAFLALLAYGYGVDRKTGEIIQNGLVFIDTKPESAQIYLDGAKYKDDTGARVLLPSGPHKLELKLDGYRDWKRSFSLAGGYIERFVYPLLFPKELLTKNQKEYAAAPLFSTTSPDRQWLLVQSSGQFLSFDVFDLGNHKQQNATITVPVGLLTASPENSWGAFEWSHDNRHVVLEHKFKGGHEFIMLDRERPVDSVNLNRNFKRNPSAVSLRDKKYDSIYLYDQAAQSLELGDIKDSSLQAALNHVLAYKTYGQNMMIYATTEGATAGKVRIVVREDTHDYPLREVSASATYLLDLARYDNHWYLAAGSFGDKRVYIYKDPLVVLKHETTQPLIPVTTLVADKPNFVSFSANTRFIMIESGSGFAVYDAENDRSFRYTLKDVAIPSGQHAMWMDGHRMATVSGGKVFVWDYDGINVQELSASLPGFIPYFDRDYTTLFAVGPSVTNPSAFALTKTSLKVLKTADQASF